jgi:hypothetical protein
MYSSLDKELIPVDLHYVGKPLQYVITRCGRCLLTTYVKAKDLGLIHMYYKGEKIHTKRVSKSKPAIEESKSFLDAICMEFNMGVRE